MPYFLSRKSKDIRFSNSIVPSYELQKAGSQIPFNVLKDKSLHPLLHNSKKGEGSVFHEKEEREDESPRLTSPETRNFCLINMGFQNSTSDTYNRVNWFIFYFLPVNCPFFVIFLSCPRSICFIFTFLPVNCVFFLFVFVFSVFLFLFV